MYYYYRSKNFETSNRISADRSDGVDFCTNLPVDQDRLKGSILTGPISLESLATAACHRGKALAVYIALRHQCDLVGKTTVILPAALLRSFGVSRDAKARALRVLEEAGLIQVKCTTGHAARVTLNG